MPSPSPRAGAGYLLAIDPGVKYAGVALFRSGRLVDASVVREGLPTSVALWSGPVAAVIIERPELYDNRHATHSDVEDLLATVGTLVARFKSLGSHVETVLPKTWKGQIPKKAHHARAIELMHPEEKELGRPYQADKFDAIALGMYQLGRTRRGGMRPID